jgi:protein gp37
MSGISSIEWTDATWNPVTGCTKISEGCRNCYAERMAKRLYGMGNARYRNGFKVTLHEDLIKRPLSWRKPKLIFVNSMSDLFHNDVPASFIRKVFSTMVESPYHIYQILTKRSARLEKMACDLPWPDNVWMGVSVESEQVTYRIDHLRQVPANVRFVSFEPLLGPIPQLKLSGIQWVIVGGESGPGARAISPDWVDQIHKGCLSSGIAFFFKQWGGIWKKRNGRLLNGRTYDELPQSAAFHRSIFGFE